MDAYRARSEKSITGSVRYLMGKVTKTPYKTLFSRFNIK